MFSLGKFTATGWRRLNKDKQRVSHKELAYHRLE